MGTSGGALNSGNFRLPTSNPGGTNQTSLGAGYKGGIGTPTAAASGQNPYLSGTPVSSPVNTIPTNPSIPTGQGGTGGTGTDTGSATYNPTSHYDSGQTDINKQLVDIFGKGVGGSLDYILKNMSGVDSQIFQQWLAGIKPVEASEQAALNQNLGSMGVSGNSSVSAIANANLQSNFNAQAAQENANLMTQNLQDTIGILTGMENPAAKEVASSGWTTFASVMNNITGDIGNLMGGSYQSPQAQGSPSAGDGASPMSTSSTLPFGQDQSMGGFNSSNFNLGQELTSGASPDLGIFA